MAEEVAEREALTAQGATLTFADGRIANAPVERV
jgi:hypothetical protein